MRQIDHKIMSRHTTGSIKFFRFSDMRYVRAVWAKDIENDFPRHIHKTYCVGIIDQGARKITTQDRTVIIPANGLFVLNPGISHRCKSFENKPHSYRVISISISIRFIKCLGRIRDSI